MGKLSVPIGAFFHALESKLVKSMFMQKHRRLYAAQPNGRRSPLIVSLQDVANPALPSWWIIRTLWWWYKTCFSWYHFVLFPLFAFNSAIRLPVLCFAPLGVCLLAIVSQLFALVATLFIICLVAGTFLPIICVSFFFPELFALLACFRKKVEPGP